MFSLYDNGKPASAVGYPELEGKGWKSHCFDTYEEADEYVRKWLGQLYIQLEPNRPVDYSGYGDLIEIREEY